MTTFVHLFRGCCAALTALAVLALAATPAPAQTLGSDGKPITNAAGDTFGVMAHRGGANEWPQNSVEAFTNAVAAGYDGIETDLRFTSDGVGVLSHDATLPSRCTKTGQQIRKLTAKQVAAVRCADLSGAKVVPIPTFADLAAVLKGHPDVVLTLDLKYYSKQSAVSMRSYAAKAMQLLKKYQLLAQTRILAYRWSTMLPTIRKYSSSIYVMAYDTGALDLGRVRLAAKLGADSYGSPMVETSAFLARYIAANKLDVTPSAVYGDEQLSFTIFYGPKKQYFMTDSPGATRAQLITGTINLNPSPRSEVTTLTTPVVVGSGTWRAHTRHDQKVLGTAVPTAARTQLDTVSVSIKVTAGAKGTLTAGPKDGGSTYSATFGNGTSTLTASLPLGNDGRIRIITSKTTKVVVTVLGYTRVRFN